MSAAACDRCGARGGLYVGAPIDETFCEPCFQAERRRAWAEQARMMGLPSGDVLRLFDADEEPAGR